MVFNDYYKKELTSLRTEGAEFSKRNPGLSTYLSKEGQDPDVVAFGAWSFVHGVASIVVCNRMKMYSTEEEKQKVIQGALPMLTSMLQKL